MYRQMDIKVPKKGATPVFQGSNPNGRDLRKVLAKLNTDYEIGLPPWFFGYGEDGKPDSRARPRISMGDNDPGSLRIIALGAEASDLLLAKSGAIQVALIRACGTLVHASMRSGPHSIRVSPNDGRAPTTHTLHRLVVGKTKCTSNWWRAVKRIEAGGEWRESEFAMLGDLITTSIFEQARALLDEGDEVEGDLGEWLEGELAKDDAKNVFSRFKTRLGLKVHSIGGHTATQSTGSQGLRVMLKNIDVTMVAKLDGPWIAGRNRIEGYGLIRASRRAPVSKREVVA